MCCSIVSEISGQYFVTLVSTYTFCTLLLRFYSSQHGIEMAVYECGSAVTPTPMPQICMVVEGVNRDTRPPANEANRTIEGSGNYVRKVTGGLTL